MCDSATASRPTPADLTDYDTDLLMMVRRAFAGGLERADKARQLFETRQLALWELFIETIPAELRQTYNCSSCRYFIRQFGGLVFLDGDVAAPAMWPAEQIEGPFGQAVAALYRAVTRAPITGPFLAPEAVLGTPITGEWHHFSVDIPAAMRFSHPLKTARQIMAEKREDFATLKRALSIFPTETVRAAVLLLKSGDALYRSEKVLGVAEWLLSLCTAIEKVGRRLPLANRRRDNLTWAAVASAPLGFCHVRSTIVGTLLDDIQAGLDIEAVQRRFAEKMHPLQYQRPAAAPSEGQIAQAEKAVQALQAAGAFRRRFARLEDVVALWKPAAKPVERAAGTGLFANVKPATKRGRLPFAETPSAPISKITWEKFRRTVLPAAKSIEFDTGLSYVRPYISLTTAADPSAPPIFQWDSAGQRTPVAWFHYHGGATNEQFSLPNRAWVPVSAVCLLPHMWHDEERYGHHGKGIVLILEGARNQRYERGALFFPELLKSEFHEYRKTMEAFARDGVLEDREIGSACGIGLHAGSNWSDTTVRVATELGTATYILERWD
jgi:hypothetical protein